jgi:hypothetical protein
MVKGCMSMAWNTVLQKDQLDELISSLQQAKDELKLRGTSE